MEGIIISDYIDKKFCKLLVINADGSRSLYEPSGNDFVKVQDFPAPLSADNDINFTGKVTVNGKLYSGEHKGINEKIELPEGKLTFKDGILTKWEAS